MDTPFDFVVENDDDTFDPLEAEMVKREYVCAVCHAELTLHYMPGDRRVLVACMEHGNVTKVGRVMRSTVGIQMEREKRSFAPVLHALPDLWGELIPPKKTKEELLHDLGF